LGKRTATISRRTKASGKGKKPRLERRTKGIPEKSIGMHREGGGGVHSVVEKDSLDLS